MKRVAVIAIVLCGSVMAACSRKDTNKANVWSRTVEPRLTGEQTWRPCRASLPDGHAVETADCGAPQTAPQECDELIATDADAVRIVAGQPGCIDSAVAALERLGRNDPDALSDLAAAYYVRAQVKDQPSDLLQSLEAADHAVRSKPSLRARFNRALALEAIGLRNDAKTMWDALSKDDHGAWRGEAKEHLLRLQREEALSAAARWKHIHGLLPQLLRAGDRDAIARLIAPFPVHAEAYLERELFGRSPVEHARMFAEILAPKLGDRFVLDLFDPAAKSGPLDFITRIRATYTSHDLSQLDVIEREAKERHYSHLLAGIQETRGYLLTFRSRYFESLGAYDAALDAYTRLGDREKAASVRMRKIGTLRDAGENEPAWREAMRTGHRIYDLIDSRDTHQFFGEAASTVLALGYPEIALLYRNAALGVCPKEQRAVALRNRAATLLHLRRYDDALNDLRESGRLLKEDRRKRPEDLRLLEARLAEVRGDAASTDPPRAAAAFAEAFDLATKEYSTYRASLLIKRAGALRAAGRNDLAETGLRDSIALLQAEEKRILEHRSRGANEDLLSAYFSRFQEAYQLLIPQLLDKGSKDEAFQYLERARAFEPLNLIEQLDVAPKELREEFDRKLLQRTLPLGTILLEYSFSTDAIHVWIVSRNRFDVLTLKARPRDVEPFISAMRSAVAARNPSLLEAQSFTLYDALIAPVLQALGSIPARLVFVPDTAMNGIPFAALQPGQTRKYLIEETVIETAGSAKLYLFSLLRDERMPRRANPQVLVIGDPAFDRSLPIADRLHRLSGARREADSIFEIYQPHAVVRDDHDATVPEFLDLASRSAVVHVAAHAIANPQYPWRSLILLAPSANDSGVLEAQDIMRKKVKLDGTRLVVLSACNSAGGLPIGPEGVAPLVRPLIVSGVPAVVGALWDVNDATSKDLLVSFHRRYRLGDDAAVALRAAQLELLKSAKPGLRPVLVWAPFQVIGHASSPFGPANDNHKEKPP